PPAPIMATPTRLGMSFPTQYPLNKSEPRRIRNPKLRSSTSSIARSCPIFGQTLAVHLVSAKRNFQMTLSDSLSSTLPCRIAVWFLAIAGGAIADWHYSKRAPEKFFNPGPVSSHHQNITGAVVSSSTGQAAVNGFSTNCDACHDKSLITGEGLSFKKFRQIVH